MNILMLTSRFGSGYGMGYSAYKEALCMADLGHAVTVGHCNSDIHNYQDKRMKYIHLPISKIHFWDFIGFYFKLQKFLKDVNINKFDLLYIQSLEFGLLDLARVNIPVSYFARSTMIGLRRVQKNEKTTFRLFNKLNHKILIKLEKRCMKYASLVYAKSSSMSKEINTLYHVEPKKIKIISGGIDQSDFKISTDEEIIDIKKKLLLPANKKIILYAGRIVSQKGLIYLVRAALELLNEIDFVVVVAGDYTEKLYYQSIIQLINNSSYKESFYFVGHVGQRKMSAIYNMVDCVVTPSLYEPFGMVNLQAAFLNKDIITTNCTGSIDLLRSYPNIQIIEPRSAEAIKQSIQKVFLTPRDSSVPQFDFTKHSWACITQEILATSFSKRY